MSKLFTKLCLSVLYNYLDNPKLFLDLAKFLNISAKSFSLYVKNIVFIYLYISVV